MARAARYGDGTGVNNARERGIGKVVAKGCRAVDQSGLGRGHFCAFHKERRLWCAALLLGDGSGCPRAGFMVTGQGDAEGVEQTELGIVANGLRD
jgi:hypothetical protein